MQNKKVLPVLVSVLALNLLGDDSWQGSGPAHAFGSSADSIANLYPVSKNVRGHENIEWSTSYAFHLTDANKDLPRILLVGDSICQGYQSKVRNMLEGKANVTYWVSSYCVTSPGYLRLLAFYLDEAKYDVIQFNNGLHSFGTGNADYEKSFGAALSLIKDRQPAAKIVWAASTPLNTDNAERSAKVHALNAAARRAVQRVGGISENDLFALMDPLDRSRYWVDMGHYTSEGYELLASQVVERVSAALSASGHAVFAGATLEMKGVVVNGKTSAEIERRDFGDGFAIRYVLPGGERFVEREETLWKLPLDAKVWYQRRGMDYEKPYAASFVRDIPAGEVVNFPVTAKLADGTYRMITEANVVDWTDSAVEYLGGGRFAVRYVNDPKGFSQTGASTTPWRVMLVAKDLQTLATSDIVRRLCPAPSPDVAAKCAQFVKRGRCIWHWLPAGAPVYARQKEWYDKTKELGFEYYLIDDGWRDWRDGDMDQWACLRKWIDYGKSIGVGTFVWVDSKEMPNAAKRRAYLGKVKEAGAVGIKIDFFPPPSYAQMARYEEILADTLELGLMTDFHGTVKPTGREKTWPHEVAREAVRGHEWHITRYGRVLPPEHDCILPFNRLVQGHADYTPVVFEKKELQGYTWARELAQGVIFCAPFLCFGDYPWNYLGNPAVELIKALPVAYDETRVLPGSEIGECAAFAKRKGKEWFVAVENGAKERSMTIALDFLGDGKYELSGFADASGRPDGYAIDRRLVGKDGKVDLVLRPGGGYCARIVPALR